MLLDEDEVNIFSSDGLLDGFLDKSVFDSISIPTHLGDSFLFCRLPEAKMICSLGGFVAAVGLIIEQLVDFEIETMFSMFG